MAFHPELLSLIRIQDPFTTQGPAAFPQEPLVGTTPFCEQPDNVSSLAGSSRRTADMRGHADDLGIHSPDDEMVGDARDLVGASRHLAGVQRSRSGCGSGPGEAVRTQNYTTQRKPGGRRASVAQVSPQSEYAGGAE